MSAVPPFSKTPVTLATEAEASFVKISGQIDTLGRILEAVRQSLAEQEAGNRQVLEALNDLSRIAGEVKGGSDEMSAGTAHIAGQVQQVEQLSLALDRSFEAIDGSLGGIKESVARAEDLSSKNTAAAEAAKQAFSRT